MAGLPPVLNAIPVVSGIIEIGKQWLGNRKEKAQAKHQRELKVIAGELDVDKAATDGMSTSWKDEYLTILFSVPLIIVFYAALGGDQETINRVEEAFATLSGLPEWYMWCVIGIVTGTFGLRGMTKLLRR